MLFFVLFWLFCFRSDNRKLTFLLFFSILMKIYIQRKLYGVCDGGKKMKTMKKETIKPK